MAENRILLIDPYRNIHPVLRPFLEEKGYPVDAVSDPKEALDRLSLEGYSAILVECHTFFDETSRMVRRAKDGAPELYVLLLSQTTIDDASYGRLLEAGVDDILLKPYSPKQILVHTRKGIRRRNLVIRTKELERESLVDPLSERVRDLILSSPYFKKCLRQEMKKAKRHHSSFSLLLVEVPPRGRTGNRFEQICVDLLRILRKSTREEDLVGRENGRFGVLLPETGRPGSQVLASRLSNLVQTHFSSLSDGALEAAAREIFFRCFSYPEDLVEDLLSESLKRVMKEVDQES